MIDSIIQTELHCHLEGAIPPLWLYNTGINKGLISKNLSYESFYNKIVLKKPMESLAAVLKYFDLIGEFLRDEDTLYDATQIVLKSIYESGIQNLELRFAPIMLQNCTKLNFDQSLAIIKKGVDDFVRRENINVGLIAIGERNYPVERVTKLLEWAILTKNDLVGVDLANREDGFKPSLYSTIFKEVKESGLGITIHCGESGFVETVKECIQIIKPDRIGHGIQIVRDKNLVDMVKDLGITLELCPTSNYITKSIKREQDHPLKYFLDKGLAVTLNTDDPGLFDVTIKDEIEFIKKHLKVTEDDLHTLEENARKGFFKFSRSLIRRKLA